MFVELPPHKGDIEVINNGEQSTEDIIFQLLRAHNVTAREYDTIANYFVTDSPVNTAKKIFRFCKNNIAYRVEGGKLQTTRTPATILKLGYGDCKHYSGFIAGVLDAVRRLKGWKFKLFYRFASYKFYEQTPEHVFIVMEYDSREYWIDPVLPDFNLRYPAPWYFIDEKIKPMALVHISGTTAEVGKIERTYTGTVGMMPIPVEYAAGGSAAVANTFDPETSALNVQYITANGTPLVLPMTNPDGFLPPLPPDGLKTVYPTTWGGKVVPSVLPRPVVIGNRIILLPKSFTQDIYEIDGCMWLIFMYRVLQPLVNAYALKPSRYYAYVKMGGNSKIVNSKLSNTLYWDLDPADLIDYVSDMPTVIPISKSALPGVKYLQRSNEKNADGFYKYIDWPLPDRYPGEPEFKIENRFIWVEYPEYFNGVKVPTNMPRPYINPDTGFLQIWPKGIDYTLMKKDFYFWLSFLTSVMSPLIRAYAPVDYTLKGNALADQLLDDIDNIDVVQNYLAIPKNLDTFLIKAIDFYKDVIATVGRAFIGISMLLPRQAFMILVRLNFCGWGRKFHQNFQRPEFLAAAKKRWEAIGGVFTNLVDSCENGREKVDLNPGTPEYKTTDVNSVAAAVGGSSMGWTGVEECIVIGGAAIAALAPLLKMFTDDKTDKIIDGVTAAANLVSTATGHDPIYVGQQAGAPTTVIDPNTGLPVTIQPPVQSEWSFISFIKANPIVSAAAAVAIGLGIYQATKKRNQ